MSDVVCEVIAQLPTKYGTFEAHGYCRTKAVFVGGKQVVGE